MKINRDNYEAFFIDYLEGNLDESVVNDFIEFIQQNPDLKQEMELLGSVSLPVEEFEFEKKEKLYREKYDSKEEFNWAVIAEMEEDLAKEEQAAFEDYLSRHPERQKEADLFRKTKLEADESVTFRKKKQLYRRSTAKTILLWASRVAAVLLLAIAAYTLIDHSFEPTGSQLAVTENEPESSAEKPAPELTDEPLAESEVLKNVPDKKSEKKEIKPADIKSATPAKKEEVQPKSKSLRENNRGRIEHEQIAAVREPVEVPVKLGALSATLSVSSEPARMAEMDKYVTPAVAFPAEKAVEKERYFADVVKEKTGLDKLSMDKITKAGLNLVSTFSKENFTYETDATGAITEVNFDSRLLAFSIPTKNEEK